VALGRFGLKCPYGVLKYSQLEQQPRAITIRRCVEMVWFHRYGAQGAVPFAFLPCSKLL
jgi:hypothetical protein